jgi:hypothetical protein
MSRFIKNVLVFVLLLAAWIGVATVARPALETFFLNTLWIVAAIFGAINFKAPQHSDLHASTRAPMLRLLGAMAWGVGMSGVFHVVLVLSMMAFLILVRLMPMG